MLSGSAGAGPNAVYLLYLAITSHHIVLSNISFYRSKCMCSVNLCSHTTLFDGEFSQLLMSHHVTLVQSELTNVAAHPDGTLDPGPSEGGEGLGPISPVPIGFTMVLKDQTIGLFSRSVWACQ